MHFQKLAWYLVLATALSIAVVLTPYLWVFGTQGLSSDHQAWSSFGGYFGGVLGPVLAFANLIAVAWIGTVIVSRQQEHVIKKQLTMDMLSEFHAEPMHSTRIALDELIESAQRNGGLLPSLSEFERIDPVCSPHAFRLYHYFEKWAVLSKTGNVDDQLLLAGLGGRVTWWDEKFFRPITARETDPFIQKSLLDIRRHILERAAATQH